MKISLAQLNPVVGDVDGNVKRIEETLHLSLCESPDLVVFPELFLVGYPPRDLLEQPWFIERVDHGIDHVMEISARYPDTGIIIGAPIKSQRETGRGLYNSALLIHNGRMLVARHKSLLPLYDVFDEGRYFDPALSIDVVRFKDRLLGISVCEDAWNDPLLRPRGSYPFDPQAVLADRGADLFINISASPFHAGKESVRFNIFSNHARKHSIPFITVNQVGGNDELIFDGLSMFLDPRGDPITILPAFKEKVVTVDIDSPGMPAPYQPMGEVESIYRALVIGIHDYVTKCGFSRVVAGLSGGIDSAVVCCLAADALGPGNVMGVTMPGPYSSAGSISDSKMLARNLGIEILEIPITSTYHAYLETLEDWIETSGEVSLTRENIQARIRGNVLMALSNEFGHLVLSTGNKSELAVGYCTLYGDMSGGLAVISDVPKTLVYRLARFINRKSPVIPETIIAKPPSAELRPGQEDQDSLPPYEVLDGILSAYINDGDSPAAIAACGFDRAIVDWVVQKVDQNEYKRRQAAPSLKVTSKAFGSGRRMPIAAKYHE